MSLRADIQEAIQGGLAALDDMPLKSTYSKAGTPTYDTDSGVPTVTMTTQADVPVLFTRYARKEIDNVAVLMNDQKAIIAALDLEQTPTVNDTITPPDSTVWKVISVAIDPSGAAWVLQIRRP